VTPSARVQQVADLIRAARYRDAEITWKRRSDSELSADDYARIVEAWLDAAEVTRARGVLDCVPAMLRNDLVVVEWELANSEEALRLGTSVYPSGVPMADRWSLPKFVSHPEDVEHWFPGRVEQRIGEDLIRVVFATSDGERVFARELTRRAFEEETEGDVSFDAPVDTFFVAVRYAGVPKMRVIAVPNVAPPWRSRVEERSKQLLARLVESLK